MTAMGIVLENVQKVKQLIFYGMFKLLGGHSL